MSLVSAFMPSPERIRLMTQEIQRDRQKNTSPIETEWDDGVWDQLDGKSLEELKHLSGLLTPDQGNRDQKTKRSESSGLDETLPFHLRMIQVATDDIYGFASLCEAYAAPPCRSRRQHTADCRYGVVETAEYERMRSQAAQSLCWLLSESPTSDFGLSFYECCEPLDVDVSEYRKLLLAKRPLSRKFLDALSDMADELAEREDAACAVVGTGR